MGSIKEINIKNPYKISKTSYYFISYYFFNDMINIKSFNSKLLIIDKKIHISYIGYITIKKLMVMKIFIVLFFESYHW